MCSFDQVYDRILNINGHSTDGLSELEALELIQSSPDNVTLSVVRGQCSILTKRFFRYSDTLLQLFCIACGSLVNFTMCVAVAKLSEVLTWLLEVRDYLHFYHIYLLTFVVRTALTFPQSHV